MSANDYIYILGSKRNSSSNSSRRYYPTPKRRNRFEETKSAYQTHFNPFPSKASANA